MDKEQIINEIEKACAPGKMSKREALDFLEDIIDRLDGNADALREEMGDDE